MEGVTILSAGIATLGVSWGIAILVAIGTFILYLAIDPFDFEDEWGWRSGMALILALVVFGLFSWLCVDTTEVPEYKVTIDETVSFVEFNEKYEVIDQEGEIYTIRERESNE